MNSTIEPEDILAWLQRTGSKKAATALARYGLPSDNAYGISVARLQKHAKTIGIDHDLALRLWDTGSLDARILAAFLGDPQRLTLAQMNSWCRDFDNWGTTDTACFKLFDRSPFAWKVIPQWVKDKGEFQKRGGFVLMACLAHHDKTAQDAAFLKFLPMIEKGSADARNFVKKGVSWALRAVGKRNPKLKSAAITLAQRLATSTQASARWVGKDALRDLKK